MSYRNTRLPIASISICALSLVFLVIAIPRTYAKAPPTLKWLKLSEKSLKHWNAAIDQYMPAYMRILSKFETGKGSLRKKIVVLVPKESESYSLAMSVFLETLQQEEIYAEIILINFGKREDLGMSALETAKGKNVDLIFSVGSESSAFIHKHYNGGEIPVVTCTQKDPVLLGQMEDYETGSGTNIAYTSLNVPLKVQIDYLFHLKPDLVNIGLMFNNNHEQVMAVEVEPAKREFLKYGLNVIEVAVDSKSTAKETLAERIPIAIAEMRKSDTMLRNSVFWITSSTAVFSQIATINRYSGDVPVLGSVPNIVSEGDDSAVLAIGIDRRNNARLASIYAVDILKGKVNPGDLKVGIVTPPDVAINFHIAKKIGLKIPFRFFESAAFIYDYDGNHVRSFGQKVKTKK